MARLSELDNIIRNAVQVLGKPTGKKWRAFDCVNGKFIGPEIAKQIGSQATNVANDLTDLENKGLIEPVGKRRKAKIYRKIPELRGVNLRQFWKQSRKGTQQITQTSQRSTLISQPSNQKTLIETRSRAIERIITIGEKLGIENVDQNWVDALVVLNFFETATTKFLTDHGFTEEKIKESKMHWEEKLSALQNKLYEEATKRGTKPRTGVLTVLKNYRNQRNELDHQAHVASARVTPEEVNLLLSTLNVFTKQIFQEHKKYCTSDS